MVEEIWLNEQNNNAMQDCQILHQEAAVSLASLLEYFILLIISQSKPTETPLPTYFKISWCSVFMYLLLDLFYLSYIEKERSAIHSLNCLNS